jgi:hypothetical protein
MPNDADLYRQRARECREEAEKAVNPSEKAEWQRIADEWLKFVESIEKRQRF